MFLTPRPSPGMFTVGVSVALKHGTSTTHLRPQCSLGYGAESLVKAAAPQRWAQEGQLCREKLHLPHNSWILRGTTKHAADREQKNTTWAIRHLLSRPALCLLGWGGRSSPLWHGWIRDAIKKDIKIPTCWFLFLSNASSAKNSIAPFRLFSSLVGRDAARLHCFLTESN